MELKKITHGIQSKRRLYKLSVIFYFIVKSYNAHSPEFTGLKLKIKIKFLFICYSFFAGSGSGTIIPDPGQSSGSATLVPDVK